MKTKVVLIGLCICGLTLRLWQLNFGLPHSHYADEPEIGEFAIKYTYELKNILTNNDVYKLVPENYVYGTLPVYFYTILVMVFSKTLGILHITFSKMDLYVYMRVINALISFAVVPIFYLILNRLRFKHRIFVLVFGTFLTAFNWKLIVHAHYLNHDSIITVFILAANLFFLRYLQTRHASTEPETDTVNTLLFGLCFGLAVSTKITVLLTLPIYLAVFANNRDFRNLFASIFVILGAFLVTNPFAWMFVGDFFARILEMQIKEGGLVFDSVDYGAFKYAFATSWLLTLPIGLLSLFGILKSTKETAKPLRQFYCLMALQVVFYLVFFTLQSRRVDRWLLPIVPNLLLFAVIAVNFLVDKVNRGLIKYIGLAATASVSLYYLYFPAVLVSQFQRNTPKSASYIWAKANLPEASTKFGLTEEGLDPLNKLPLATIWQFNAYESKGGQFMYPPDPLLYDYIIISSRPMAWTKNPIVVEKYPYYASKWLKFDQELNNYNDFKLIKSFETSDPNLIPLSSVHIYKKTTGSLLK